MTLLSRAADDADMPADPECCWGGAGPTGHPRNAMHRIVEMRMCTKSLRSGQFVQVNASQVLRQGQFVAW